MQQNGSAGRFAEREVRGIADDGASEVVTIWIERMRLVEVYYGASFKRTSQGAVDAIPVLPGATRLRAKKPVSQGR